MSWKTMRLTPITTRNGGFILVLVLCTIILLGVLLFGFNRDSRAELMGVNDLKNSVHALNCAKAGLSIAIAALASPGGPAASPKLASLLSGQERVTLGGGTCSITLVEENSKLNVNMLRTKTGSLDRTRIDQLLRLVDLLNRQSLDDSRIGYALVPSIIDWTDDDEEVTVLPFVKYDNLGAESDYYAGMASPYRCRNDSLETVEELLLLKGITADVFQRIGDYVTVYGDGMVNINSASKLVIQSLSEQMDSALAEMIITRRQTRPFATVTELRDLPGMTDAIYQDVKKTAAVGPTDAYYQVIAEANADGAACTITAMLRKNAATKSVDVILYKEL